MLFRRVAPHYLFLATHSSEKWLLKKKHLSCVFTPKR